MKHDQFVVGLELIKKDFGLEDDFDEEVVQSYDRLKMWLTRQVKNMLDRDFNGLLNALYRIDVEEGEVRQILATAYPDALPEALTKLILDREMEKAKWRTRYREQ